MKSEPTSKDLKPTILNCSNLYVLEKYKSRLMFKCSNTGSKDSSGYIYIDAAANKVNVIREKDLKLETQIQLDGPF